MIRITFTAAALTFTAAFASAPAQAEIVKAECKLSMYGDTPINEIFPCDFRQSAGNAQIWSKNWNFEFLAVDQGKTYVRINSNPLSFHRLGKYSLFVFQNGMPAEKYKR